MANRFLDRANDEVINSLEELNRTRFAQADRQKALARSYAESVNKNPNLVLPELNTDGTTDYGAVVQQLLNDLAKGTYNSVDQVQAAIESNSVLRNALDTDTIKAAANHVFQRSMENQRDETFTHSAMLDKADKWTSPNITEVGTDSFLGNILPGAWDTVKDIGGIVGNVLGVTDHSKIESRREELARSMSDLGKDTQTGMQKMYTLRDLQNQAEELKKQAGIFNLPEDKQRQLDVINSKIRAISGSFSAAELEAINKNGKMYDQFNRERESLAGVDPENWAKKTYYQALHEEERKSLEREQKFFRGNADIFDLDNLAYDWDLAKSYLTADQLGGFVGEMLPWAIGAEFIGGIGAVSTLGKGLVKATMGIGKTGASRAAIANAFKEIGTSMTTISGATKGITSGMSYAGAYSKSSTEWLNEYFDREGTVEGFNSLEAGLYGMAEHLANFYGGKTVGQLIPGKYSAKALSNFFKSDVERAMTAARTAISEGADASALANASISYLFKQWKDPLARAALADKIFTSPAQALDKLGTKALNKAETIQKSNTLLGKVAATGETDTLKGLGYGAKISSKFLSNGSGVSIEGFAKGGLSLATDNALAAIAREKGKQKGDIDWNEVGKSAIEGLVAGAAGHVSGLGVSYAKGVAKGLRNKPNGYYDPIDIRKQKLDLINSEEYQGTAKAHNILDTDIKTLKKSYNSLTKEKDNIEAKIKKEDLEDILTYDASRTSISVMSDSEALSILKKKGVPLSQAKAKLKKAKKLADAFNKKTEIANETSKRLEEDTDLLLKNASKYLEKNPDKEIPTNPYLSKLLDKASDSDIGAENVSFHDFDKQSGTERIKTIDSSLTDKQAEHLWEATNKAKVHSADEIFGEITKKDGESDADFNTRKQEETTVRNQALATARVMGRTGIDLDDLTSDEVKLLADHDWDKLSASLDNRAKNSKDAKETKRLNRLKDIYNSENFENQKTELDPNNVSLSELKALDYLPTAEGLKDKVGHNVTDKDIAELEKTYAKGYSVEDFNDTMDTYTAKSTQDKINEINNDASLSDVEKQTKIADIQKTKNEEAVKSKAEYKAYTDMIDEAIKAHNELVKAGTYTRNTKSEVEEELNKNEELKNNFEVKEVSYYKKGRKVTKAYAKKKPLAEEKQAETLQSMLVDLVKNNMSVADQLDTTKEGLSDEFKKEANAKADILDKMLKDPGTQKALKDLGLGSIKDLETFKKQRDPVQLKVLSALTGKTAKDIKYKQYVLNKAIEASTANNKKSVVTHYITGHRDLQSALNTAYNDRLKRESQRLAEKNQEVVKQLEDNLNVSWIKELDKSALKKQIFTTLDSLGFFESDFWKTAYSEIQDKHMDVLNDPSKKLNNTIKKNVEDSLNKWVKGLNISQKGMDQLNWLQAYLGNQLANEYNSDIAVLHDVIAKFNTLVQKYNVPNETSKSSFFDESIKYTDFFSNADSKVTSRFNKFVAKDLANLDNLFNKLGVAATTHAVYSQMYDWTLDSMLASKVDTKFLSNEAKSFLMSRLHKGFIGLSSTLRNLALSKEFNAIWDFLTERHERKGLEGSVSVLEQLAAMSATADPEIKAWYEFMNTLDSLSSRVLKEKFKELDFELQNKILNHLLTQTPVLGKLGLIPVLKSQEKNPDPWKRYKTGANLATQTTTDLLNIRNRIRALSDTLFNPKAVANTYSENTRDAFIFTLLNNLSNVDGCSISFVQSEFIRNFLDNILENHGKEALEKSNSANEFLVNYYSKKLVKETTDPNNNKQVITDEGRKKVFEMFLKQKSVINLFKSYTESAVKKSISYDQVKRILTDYPKVGATIEDATFVEQFVTTHIGELALLSQVYNTRKSLFEGTKDKLYYKQNLEFKKIEDTFRRLSNAVAHKDDMIMKYTSFEYNPPESVSEEDFDTFYEVLRSYPADTVQYVMDAVHSSRYDGTDTVKIFNEKSKNLFNYDKKTKKHSFKPVLDTTGTFTSNDRLVLAQLFNDVINAHELFNTSTTDINAKVNFNVGKNNIIQEVHNHHSKILEKGTLKNSPNNCVLAIADGKEKFLQENSTSGIYSNAKEIFKWIDEMSVLLNTNLAVNTSSTRLVDNIETINGAFSREYFDIVSACALSQLPTISTDITDDYYETLLTRYGNSKVADTFKNNKLADQDVLNMALGESIARSLGYNADSYLFDDVAREAGQHALVALALAGYINLVRINKITGDMVKEAHGADLANTVRAVQITAKGQSKGHLVSTRCLYNDAEGSHNLLDQLTGSDTQHSTSPAKGNKEYKARQESLKRKFKTPLPKMPRKGEVYWDHNSNIAAVCTLDDNGNPEWVYMKGKAILKTDKVALTDERLYQLALKSKHGKDFYTEQAWDYFKCVFEIKNGLSTGKLKYTDQDAERIDELVKENPELGLLIRYNNAEIYAVDADQLQGNFAFNIQIKNREAFRKLLRDARFLAVKYQETLKKGEGFGKSIDKFYYDEINTVNNRAFVDNILFNYRETPQYRFLFSMNNIQEIKFKNKDSAAAQGNETTLSDRVYPILASLGLKYDKLNPVDDNNNKLTDDDMVNNVWENLITLDAFQDLLYDVSLHLNEPGNILKAINSFNTRVKQEAKKDPAKYSYNIVSPGLNGGKAATKVFSLGTSIETVTALQDLFKITVADDSSKAPSALINTKIADKTDWKNAVLNSLRVLSSDLGDRIISNYKIRVEIDGLTNGPSIKEIIDALMLRNNRGARLIINGVGVNPLFCSVMASQLEGVLDTYLLNSAVAQQDLNLEVAKKIIVNNYKDDESLIYLRTLYNLSDNNLSAGFIDIMANILNRDMMKKPTMVTGYEAGMATVLLKMAMQFDVQASTLLNSEDTTAARAWLKKACELNGGSVQVRFIEGKKLSDLYTLTSDGMVNGINIFEDANMRRLVCFATTDNTVMHSKLNSMLQSLYQSMTRIMKEPQTPFDQNNEATQVMAESINAIMFHHMQEYFEAHEDGIDYIEYRKYLDEESKKICNKICTIFPVGNSRLQTMRRAVNRDLPAYFASMTCTQNGKIFIRTEYKLANFEALGAGEVPMIIHSYDSEIVHEVQQIFTEMYKAEILAVHDAIIVGPLGVSKSPEMNKAYYRVSYLSKATLVARDNALLRSIENIAAMDLPDNLKDKLLSRLRATYLNSANYTINLIREQLDFLQKELGKKKENRMKYNQYSLGETSTFIPEDADLKEGIAFLYKELDKMTSSDLYLKSAEPVIASYFKNAIAQLDVSESQKSEIVKRFFKVPGNTLLPWVYKNAVAVVDSTTDKYREGSSLLTVIEDTVKREFGEPVANALMKNIDENALRQDISQDIISKNPMNVLIQSIKPERDTSTGMTKYESRRVNILPNYNGFNSETNHQNLESTINEIVVLADNLTKVPTLTNNNLIPWVVNDRDVRISIQNAIIRVLSRKGVTPTDLTVEDKFDILQEATGYTLNNNQRLAYNNLRDNLNQIVPVDTSVSLSEYNPNKPIYLDCSADLDYEAIEERFNVKFNREAANNKLSEAEWRAGKTITINGQSITIPYKQWYTYEWYKKNVYEPVKEFYSNIVTAQPNEEIQIAFNLTSKMDELRYRALMQLKASDPAFKNIKVVLIPLIGSAVSQSPHVGSRLLGQYIQLFRVNPNIRTVYNCAPGADLDFMSLISNTDMTEANIVHDSRADSPDKVKIFVPNEDLNGDYMELRSKYSPKTFHINKLNEVGESRGVYSKDITGKLSGKLDPYMLANAGIRQDLANEYGHSQIAARDNDSIRSEIINPVTNAYSIYGSGKISGNITANKVAHDQLDYAIVDDENSVLNFNITSFGDLTDSIPFQLSQHMPMLSKAMTMLKSEMMSDLARYNNNEITWEDYIRPRAVTVDIGTGKRKTFMFTVTRDTSVTREQLTEAVEMETFRGVTTPKEVIKDTEFSNMLNKEYLTNPGKTYAFVSKYGTDNIVNKTKRVPIPIHMLDNSKLFGISSDELNMRNAVYINQMIKDFRSKGRNIDHIYFASNDLTYSTYLPNNGTKYTWLTLTGLKEAAMDTVNQSIMKRISGYVHNKAVDWVKKYMHVSEISNKPVDSNINRMSGYAREGQYRDFSVIPDLAKQVLNSGKDIQGVLDNLIQEDNNNGIDTSHLTGLSNTLANLTTNIVLFVDRANDTTKGSMEQFVEERGNTREQIYLAWGRPTESKTEAFLHELCHTIFNQLPRDSVAYKQAIDLFNYVQKHFTINSFEDGDTLENRDIIDSIFSAKTQDSVSEFLVYAMTNKKFQNALANMEIPDKIKNAIEKRTTGIFNRFVNTIDSWLNGTEAADSTATVFPMVMDLFNTAVYMNNSYWNETNKLNTFVNEYTDLAILRELISDKSMLAKALDQLPSNKVTDIVKKALKEGYKHDYREPGDPAVTDDFLAILIRELRNNVDIKEGFINDLLSSFEGASQDQMPYLKMRMAGKKAIDWYRNQGAEAVNDRVKEILKDYPASQEKKLTDYYVRADVSCLFNSPLNENQIKELLINSRVRQDKIHELENRLSREPWKNFYINASKGLAQYLTTGFNPTGLAYRNAYEIVAMSGSSHQQITNINGEITNTVDQLTTLYAVDYLANKDITVYEALTPKMLKELSSLHNSIKQAEYEAVYGDSAQKYHIPKGQVHGGTVRGRYDIIPEENLKAYEWNGYKKVHDAELDPFYRGVANRSNTKYVIVSAPNKNPVPTVAGCTVMTDIFKGRSKSGLSFNHENDLDKDIDFRTTLDWQRLKNYVNSRVEALNKPNPQLIQNETDGNLVLNFNYLGEMNGANFELNPIKTDHVTKRKIKISSVFGDLFGSVQERTQVPEFNKKVGEACLEIYENAEDPENFVWISDTSENKDHRDFYDALPYDVKKVVEENYKYKEKGLPIRKKALNTFFGYRHMSSNDTKQMLKDIEDEKLNLDNLTSSFSNAIKGIFYSKWVGRPEQFIKWMASTGKENIVIKGIATSWYNIVSNCVTLGINGLSSKELASYQVEAFKQIKTLDDINYDLRQLQIKRMEGRYTNSDAQKEKALLNAGRALPIYPLIKAGAVANTLAEDLTETDRFVKDTIDKYAGKGMLNIILQNALLTPKAYMYKILSDFASLGDSTGKYAIYKYLTKKGVSSDEAIRQATNMFIDYSNPIPKEIQYADDLGTLPFIKFALGTQTNILNTVVKHPDRSLGWLFANSALGTPVPDIFQSLIGLDTITNRLQMPGELFVDSISQLPSIRITNTLMDTLD